MEFSYGNLNLYQLVLTLIFSTCVFKYIGKKYEFSLKRIIVKKDLFALMIFLFTCILLVFLCSFRTIGSNWSKVGGYDAWQYKDYFYGNLKNTHYEIGFRILIDIIRLLFKDYSIFLIIVSSFMIYSMCKYLKETNCYNFFLILMLIICYFESFNTLRTNLAIFVFLLILVCLKKNKYFMAIILTFISVSIHISAIIIIPCIILNYIYKNKNKIPFVKILIITMALCLVCYILAFALRGFLQNTVYSSYVDNSLSSFGIFVFAGVVYFISYFNYDSLVKYNTFNKVLLISLPVIYIVLPMETIYVILYRMGLYFLPIIYTLMSNILIVKKDIFIKLIVIMMFAYKIYDFLIHAYYIGIN